MIAFKLLLCATVLCVCMRTGLSATTSYFQVVRRDTRKCLYPVCGGFYVEKVNVPGATYVGRLFLDKLDPRVLQAYNHQMRTLPGGYNLVVYGGSLVNDKQYPQILDLSVSYIYLGYAGANVTFGPGVKYYSLSQPFGAKNAKATILNTAMIVTVFNARIIPTQPTGFLDQNAQLDQVLSKGALVIASIASPKILIKQVFFEIPVYPGPCPVDLGAGQCKRPKSAAYTRRGQNFCFFTTCVNRICACPFFIPGCPKGYKLASWSAPPCGCPHYQCDPFFFPDPSIP